MWSRPIHGRCLLALRSAAVEDADARQYIQCRLDSFVQIDNIGIEMFVKTFQGALGNVADHNFKETTGFVSGVSRTAEAAPENIQRIATKLQRVTPEERQEFVAIGHRVAARADQAAARTADSRSRGAPTTAEVPRTATK
jgi:hypothetical protein